MRRGLLIIDRGSREKEAHDEMRVITQRAMSGGQYDYADYCFLEVLPPFIDDAMKKCLTQKLDTLTIVPYFLYPGKKVKVAVRDAMKYQEKTEIKFLVTRPMSMHPTMVQLVDNRVQAALLEYGHTIPRQDTDVLIIGHGSTDINAQMSINYVVKNLQQTYRRVSRCFLEIEQPDINAGIQSCQKDNPKVLAVVFYFLHEGAHVKRDINADLLPALEKSTIQNVCITKHLGTDDKMINLILERAREVEGAD